MSSNSNKTTDRIDRYNHPDIDYEGAAAYLGLTVRQVKRAVESGKLGRVKLGGLHVRFSQAQLDAYIEACTIAPTANALK